MSYKQQALLAGDCKGHIRCPAFQRRLTFPSQIMCLSSNNETIQFENVSAYFHIWKYTSIQKGINDDSCHSSCACVDQQALVSIPLSPTTQWMVLGQILAAATSNFLLLLPPLQENFILKTDSHCFKILFFLFNWNLLKHFLVML